MATTALVIITDALAELGIYAAGETIASADQSQGLDVLNRLIDAWADEKLFPQIVTAISWSIAAGTSAYTIGPGATINVERPLGLAMGPGQGSATVAAVTTNLNVVSGVEWSAFQAGNPTQAGTPNTVWYNPRYPNGVINVTPTALGTAAVNGLYPLVSFAAVGTSYILSPGVQDALTHNLAMALKPYFSTGQIAPEIVVLARETKNFLRMTSRTSRGLLGRDMVASRQAGAA